MRRYLARLVALGFLLGFGGQLLAQGTMETRQGSRHVESGGVSPSASTFAVGLTRDNGASFVGNASVSDIVQLRGEVRPEPANVGQTADIFVVAQLLDGSGAHMGFVMRNVDGIWLPWDGRVPLLVPFEEDRPLTQNYAFTLYSGAIGIPGNFRLYIGYMATDGLLRYHTTGHPITITDAPTQSPLDEAKNYFSSTINPGIVPFCLDCHVSGGSAQGLSLHTFVPGSDAAAIDTNFGQFRSLFNARGKAFILAKVRGENSHVGGTVLPSSSSQYRDLETFLDLLSRL